LKWLLALLVGVAASVILFRKPVQEAVMLRSLLMSDSASETPFLALADGAKDQFAFLQRIWTPQNIPHRALVATYLKDKPGAPRRRLPFLDSPWHPWHAGHDKAVDILPSPFSFQAIWIIFEAGRLAGWRLRGKLFNR
jgi:hypothetical protein